MIFQSVTQGLESKTPSTPQYSDFSSEPPVSLTEKSSFSCIHQAWYVWDYYVRHVATENFNCGQGKVDLDSKIFLSFAVKLNILSDYMSHKRFVATLIFLLP